MRRMMAVDMSRPRLRLRRSLESRIALAGGTVLARSRSLVPWLKRLCVAHWMNYTHWTVS